MNGTWNLGRFLGVDVKLHFSFFLVVLLGVLQWGGEFGLPGAIFGALFTLLLFSSIVAHELAHSWVAMAFGVPVREIVLWPLGGMAIMERQPKRPWHELLIASAGPAMSMLLGAFLGFILYFFWDISPAEVFQSKSAGPSWVELILLLCETNWVLAFFNLLPALPMDGGRIFRALLSMVLSPLTATRVAVWVARVCAAGMVWVGLSSASPMLAVIGVLVFFSSGAEAKQNWVHHALGSLSVDKLCDPQAPVLSPALSLEDALRLTAPSPSDAYPVLHGEQCIGILTRPGLLAALEANGPFAYVAGAMLREFPRLTGEQTLDQAMEHMQRTALPWAIVEKNGSFVGLLNQHQLAARAEASVSAAR